MTTTTKAGGAGFAATVLSEWTKLRTVRSWRVCLLASVALTVLVSVLGASGSSTSGDPGGPQPIGPGGQPVTDSFHLRHLTLVGDGAITARVASLGGPGTLPDWAKAGVIVKESTQPGSRYAAAMVTASHGVRLQSNYVDDRPGSGPPPGSPTAWLRLIRDGGLVHAYESLDGSHWSDLGTADVGLGTTRVEVGLFVASPMSFRTKRGFASSSAGAFPTTGVATFTDVQVTGTTLGNWHAEDIGTPAAVGSPGDAGSTTMSGVSVTLTGSGDIAPDPPDADLVRMGMTGVFIGILPVIAVSVLFMTAEYRSGMVATSLAATSRRGRLLAAKSLVIGIVTLAAGLIGSVLSHVVAQPILRTNGFEPPSFPSVSLTDGPVIRAIVGTAVVVALIAVLSLALATVVRRSAAAIAVTVLLIVLPQVLVSGLPLGAARLLLQATPGAGFAVQRTVERFEQVETLCLPEDGCLFKHALAGLGVTGLYAIGGLLLATSLFRRRDA